jgi:hypothetical protein
MRCPPKPAGRKRTLSTIRRHKKINTGCKVKLISLKVSGKIGEGEAFGKKI